MDLIDREWVLNNPDKPCTFVDAVMCAPKVEAIPIEVIDKIRTEINELSSYVAKFNGGDFAIHIDKEKVFEIIDKYRGEVDCRECKAEYECYYCKKYAESELKHG